MVGSVGAESIRVRPGRMAGKTPEALAPLRVPSGPGKQALRGGRARKRRGRRLRCGGHRRVAVVRRAPRGAPGSA